MSFLRCFTPPVIGDSVPAPVIAAEMSGNHGGSLERAIAIVEAVAEAGAELVKFQTYTADTLTIDVDLPQFRVSAEQDLWGGRSLYQLYEEAHTPWEWHAPLFERARELGVVPFSSPFDPSAVELLESLDCALYKLASAEITDLPLIREVSRTGKPVVLSTGMATVSEIEQALEAVRSTGNDQVTLLACTAAYPARPVDARLANIRLLRELFNVPVGLSDHTLGVGVAIAAVASGAVMIEKHVALESSDPTVDSEFSMDPAELRTLVTEAHRAWEATSAAPSIGPIPAEEPVRRLRRSLYVVSPVKAGEPVTRENVRSIRPAGGLEPDRLEALLGRPFRLAAERGTPLTWDLL